MLAHATTLEAQERCIEALITKTQILWALLDAIDRGAPLLASRALAMHVIDARSSRSSHEGATQASIVTPTGT